MGELHIPIIDEDKFDDIITALQALAAPSGTNVAISPTGMHIVTEDDVQGAISELDAGLYSTNASLTQLDGQISTAKFGIDSGNKTSFSFTNLHNLDNQSIYKHALVFIGAGPTQTTLYAVYINEHNTNVAFINLSSNTGRTLTGSVSGTTLTITTDSTCYGGLKLIWLT